MVDSATLLWTLCHTALLEEKQKEKPGRQSLIEIEYAEANGRMQTIISLAREYDKNLVLIHHTTDKYGPITIDGRTQQMPVGITHAGWKHVTKHVDLEVWLSVPAISKQDRAQGKKMTPTEVVTLSGLTLEAQGQAFSDGSWEGIFNHIYGIRGELERMTKNGVLINGGSSDSTDA